MNNHKQVINLREFNSKSTINSVLAEIFEKWDETKVGEKKPASASSIRLIHLGKQLSPNQHLSDLNLTYSDIIHLSIKPDNNSNSNITAGRSSNSNTRDTQKTVTAELDPSTAAKSSKCCVIT